MGCSGVKKNILRPLGKFIVAFGWTPLPYSLETSYSRVYRWEIQEDNVVKCSSNNLAETVRTLFLESIEENNNLWPSRIRVDYGVENVLVCDEMVSRHGPDRNSFIAGSSTRNQRIERLWRDVFRCVAVTFYYVFYAMEQSGILHLDNELHMFILHLVFLPRINQSLSEFKAI